MWSVTGPSVEVILENIMPSQADGSKNMLSTNSFNFAHFSDARESI